MDARTISGKSPINDRENYIAFFNRLRMVLEYSPYDNKRNSPFGNNNEKAKNKEEFYNKFFVQYSWGNDNLNDKMQEAIDGVDNFVLFYGASGSGKTTYLNYFIDNNADKYYFHNINLIEFATPTEFDLCIRESIISLLCDVLDNKDSGVIQELYQRVVVDGSYIPFDQEADNNLFTDYLVDSILKEKKSMNYLKRIGLYDKNGNSIVRKSNEKFLTLYVLAELFTKSNDLHANKKHVFVFDNLDEIPTQYIVPALYDMLLSVYSEVQKYCDLYTNFSFLSHCTFIMSFRSTNAQIIDSTQHQERLFMTTKNIEFGSKYQVFYSNILNRRMEYFFANEKEVKYKELIIRALELLNTENEYCAKVLRPLFNYDYRMYTVLFITNLFRQTFNTIDEKLIKSKENEDRRNTAVQTGARGILLFYALESMMSYDSSRFMNYVRHEFENDTLCNVYRMSFTLLSNFGGWSMTNDIDLHKSIKDENDFHDGTPRISLFRFVKNIENWYGKELVITAIEGLLGSTAYNFEYPVVLIGRKIDEYYAEPTNSHTTSGLSNYIVGLYNEDKNLLTNIYIKINPLCVLYSWRVFINFEYYNLISTLWDHEMIREYRYTPIPLFLINNEYLLKSCLRSVFLTVKLILNMADSHFCDKCFDFKRAKCQYKKGQKHFKRNDVKSSAVTCSESFSTFIEEGFCVQNSLYSTRLITSHINYLERYRRYLRDKIKNDSEKSGNMQRIIIEQMVQYVSLWGEERVVTSQNLFEKYNRVINYAHQKMFENPYVEIEITEE